MNALKPQNGIQYFILGSSAKLRKGGLTPAARSLPRASTTDYAFMVAEISGDEMSFQAISRTGTVVDSGKFRRVERKTATELKSGETVVFFRAARQRAPFGTSAIRSHRQEPNDFQPSGIARLRFQSSGRSECGWGKRFSASRSHVSYYDLKEIPNENDCFTLALMLSFAGLAFAEDDDTIERIGEAKTVFTEIMAITR